MVCVGVVCAGGDSGSLFAIGGILGGSVYAGKWYENGKLGICGTGNGCGKFLKADGPG